MQLLDKHSPVPIYVQIEKYLQNQIAEGVYPVASSIPSERELAEIFGVSRMTVRQSITNLVNEGYLYREKGRGTYVADLKVEQPLTGMTSFTEDMIARGMEPSNRVLSFEKTNPDATVQAGLRLKEGEEVYLVKRIRYADHKPMAIEQSYLPVKLFPNLQEEAIAGSLYSLIEKDQHLAISRASQRMEAALVKKEEAQLLQIEMPAAVLIIERTSYLTNDVPFEYVRSTYRADRYKFVSEIQR